ncbi:ribosome recycling factor [Eggerthia catenaformis OT 569 = DSM 20559]|uniref:Ribosome-recycling factor n=1 Tax=Eggerthia catenaformis OT 569 = DSM 20559 TaxID=999415 RepID=M2P7L6_9FIRM|nr:ribosome recycling factor [Eggerthia catenaformis]EMD16307.1 ribosome recycling factor [Eggerthia catenaformis OT 569 = DSM 20559]OUC50799.1 ribosome-recycling factor [Eggerthia catenaformis]
MDEEMILLETEEKMEKTIKAYKNELVNIRTGRANPSMLDRVMVDYYGSPTPLNQISGISVVEGRQLLVKPYDKSSMKDIERAVYEADLGLTPQNDGAVIRINIPPLTEERRKELVKQVKKLAEEAKIAIRNQRRKANDLVEKGEDEDAVKEGKKDIQKLTDKFIQEIDDITKDKESDLMTV